MNLLAGVGNGLFILPAVGKLVAISVKYAGLTWLAVQSPATPGQAGQ